MTERLEPTLDVGGMVFAGLQLQAQVGAEEGGAQFGNEFFAGVAFVAPALAPKSRSRRVGWRVHYGCIRAPTSRTRLKERLLLATLGLRGTTVCL
jgi:hypothetical protein